jgi:hypothetical protein
MAVLENIIFGYNAVMLEKHFPSKKRNDIDEKEDELFAPEQP